MFGLPQSTELNRQLPKKSIYSKFRLNTADRVRFDADIRKLTIIGEISPATVNIEAGENVTAFYVILVSLRTQDYDEKNIVLLSKLINQSMLFALEYEGKARLAVFCTKLLQAKWVPVKELKIKLIGLNLDAVWENIIIQVGNVEMEKGNTLEEQLAIDEEREKLRRQIERLERRARSEKQPRRKLEMVQQVKRLKSELSSLIKGE
ncbi:DUF4391 domain-containing protein [Syntrophomonas wolfei]|jgi:hypothetical protein|uniref:DUF4391 domain-containing protein n=1 Tax=Syntrophomonas wolfei TaxID=863 RepID=UPI0023F3D816|nr:DUF4391 domain-containing protein [Syntrophomonas wolfei]